MGQEITKWTLLVGMAVAIHVGAFAIWEWVADPLLVTDAGGAGLQIALAPAQVSADDQSETVAIDTNEPAPPVVEPVEVSRVEPALPDTKDLVEEVVMQPERPASEASTNLPANVASDTSSVSTGRAAGNAGVADASVEADYLAHLADWLARHKRYPRTARRRNLEGVAELTFTLTRYGELVRYRVSRSSGYDILDREVREMLKRAAPLPEFPAELSIERMDVTIPVRFELTQN